MQPNKTNSTNELQKSIDLAPINNLLNETNQIQFDINTYTNASKKQIALDLGKWSLIGSFMGVSDAIPGYSGGTTLALIGTLDRLVFTAKNIFKPAPNTSRLKSFIWMLPFFIGWTVGVFGFAKLTEFLVDHNFGIELVFGFAFFIIMSIPNFLKMENPRISKSYKKNERYRHGIYIRRMLVLIGFCFILTLALITYFRGGMDWGSHPSKVEHSQKIFDLAFVNSIKLICVAMLAGAMSIIPGGSGAIIQLIFNKYRAIHWTIMAHPTSNILALFIFVTSTLIGMLVSIFALSWLLKNKRSYLCALSFGMLIAAVISLFIVPQTSIWSNISEIKHIFSIIGVIILAIFGATIINLRIKFKSKKLINIIRSKKIKPTNKVNHGS